MRWILFLWLFCFAAPAMAQVTAEEQRARDIGAQLRCVVCQNQSIEDSDAELAKDMRILVREYIAQGASDEEVISHIRDSYGDYVLLKPPLQANTYALWFFPFGLVIFCLFWFLLSSRRKTRAQGEIELSETDRALLDSLMEDTP